MLQTLLKPQMYRQPTLQQGVVARRAEEPIINIKTIFSANQRLEDIDDMELARQLTLMEFDIYKQIQVGQRRYSLPPRLF